MCEGRASKRSSRSTGSARESWPPVGVGQAIHAAIHCQYTVLSMTIHGSPTLADAGKTECLAAGA
jgi:hypothetical protein